MSRQKVILFSFSRFTRSIFLFLLLFLFFFPLGLTCRFVLQSEVSVQWSRRRRRRQSSACLTRRLLLLLQRRRFFIWDEKRKERKEEVLDGAKIDQSPSQRRFPECRTEFAKNNIFSSSKEMDKRWRKEEEETTKTRNEIKWPQLTQSLEI